MRVNHVVVFVSEMQRSVLFYRDVLGLPLKFESAEWTEFTTNGATLALHASEAPNSRASDARSRLSVAAGRVCACRTWMPFTSA